MASSRNCVIGSLIAVAILILGGIGIYFAVVSGESKNNNSTDEFLIKYTNGTVASYSCKTKTFTGTKLEEKLYGIVSFSPYLNETIYYATTETNSVIKSTNKIHKNLPMYTANWVKTAIAVDEVTKKVYVVDRVDNKIRVVDGNHYYNLPLKLTEPLDLVLAPERGNMFVLEKSRIITANMDGTEQTEIVKANNLHAMTADSTNGVVYFAHPKGISSYDSRSKKALVVNGVASEIKSLAYNDTVLYFVNKKGKSSKKPGTSLDYCRLDESDCPGQCCHVYSVFESDKLEQVKIYKSEKPKTKNPCEKENGGCQHLCLLNTSEEGRSCACDKDWTLQPDKKTCKASVDPNDSSVDKLFVKSTDGTVKVYDRKTKEFTTTEIETKPYGILSFGPHLDQTIYYATTEAGSVIQSTKKDAFPDLPSFTADWTKTAIAVDDVTKKVYVVDRVAPRIKVVDGNHYYILPLKLTEPVDLVLAPGRGNMFVLEKSRIIMANMDGTEQTEIVKANNLHAMTADIQGGIVYYAYHGGIESYDLKSKKAVVVNGVDSEIKSLAYNDTVLYFVHKKGKSSKKPGTSLDYCRLDESDCPGQCCHVYSVFESEKLEQVKIYKSEKPKTKNPCEKENGGCQHLCLLNTSKEGRSCACNQGWILHTDKKTCV